MSNINTAAKQQESQSQFISHELDRLHSYLYENTNRLQSKMRDLTGYEGEPIKDSSTVEPENWSEGIKEKIQMLADQAKRIELLAEEFAKFI